MKMDLALNNQQRLICYKVQTNKQKLKFSINCKEQFLNEGLESFYSLAEFVQI